MRILTLVLCLAVLPVFSATTSRTPSRPVANAADVTFAIHTVESAVRQYEALPEPQKAKLEAKVAKAAGLRETAEVRKTLRTIAQSMRGKTFATKQNQETVRLFLNANPKWCSTVKAARLARQAMVKMGLSGEMSLNDLLNLLPD